MFKKVLIANRGEIACRVIRACRNLNVKTVSVYSEADKRALHVKMADEAYFLGPSSPKESYLNAQRIIEVAGISGADGVHPGYGFLSENPGFARACQEADVRFIGPYPYVMEAMGDKVKARKLARKAGLPVLPGTRTAVGDAKAANAAWELGFPLMLKATQGGGGIGIRIIDSLDHLTSVIKQEREMARHAFGSAQLYLERYVPEASHIEVQILGDEHGNLVHLFERDCSVQRRNQKIVEETPAVKLDDEQRARLCEYALMLGRHIGYTNAGTVEFLVAPGGAIFFLEMNTRLQVEHGITEMVTGLDLVELQLRVASGEHLPLCQSDIHVEGHAIEARIYPEDPETFIPMPGKVEGFRHPSGKHVRVDSSLFPGYEVLPDYDSLMAKLMCWGTNREDARKRLDRALCKFRLDGINSNIPAIRKLINHPSFVDSTYTTSFISSVTNGSRNGHLNGYANGDGDDRELAAAIAVSTLLSMNGNAVTEKSLASRRYNAWKLNGRRDQMLARSLGRSGWR